MAPGLIFRLQRVPPWGFVWVPPHGTVRIWIPGVNYSQCSGLATLKWVPPECSIGNSVRVTDLLVPVRVIFGIRNFECFECGFSLYCLSSNFLVERVTDAGLDGSVLSVFGSYKCFFHVRRSLCGSCASVFTVVLCFLFAEFLAF